MRIPYRAVVNNDFRDRCDMRGVKTEQHGNGDKWNVMLRQKQQVATTVKLG